MCTGVLYLHDHCFSLLQWQGAISHPNDIFCVCLLHYVAGKRLLVTSIFTQLFTGLSQEGDGTLPLHIGTDDELLDTTMDTGFAEIVEPAACVHGEREFGENSCPKN